ncbi:MAG: hypothetical protein GY930_08385 [bacterium]|nr:hypothetical protein [bacterium]
MEDFERRSGQIELPVGQYRLVVTGAHGKVSSGTNHRPLRLGRKESFIQVERATTRSYHVSPKKAGKLRIHIQGSPTDSDLLVAKFDGFHSLNSTWGPGMDNQRHNAYPWEPESIAKLTLYRKDRLPIPIEHTVSGTSSIKSVCDRWPLNRKLVSDPLPPGEYLLVTELAARRRVQQTVTIVSGKVVDVQVDTP